MRQTMLQIFISVAIVIGLMFPSEALSGPAPVIIGVPSSLNMIEAAEGLKAIRMAVEEINAKGGVRVGDQMRPFKVEAIDTRGGEPGVPISDALLSIKKLFLEKKPHAVVLGPFRSEVLLAAMDLYAKYEMVSLNVAMTPKFVSKYKGNPEKYKYCFRMLDARHVVGYLMKVMGKLSADYGFKKVYIINQDVLWANGIGNGMKKWFEKNNWEVTGHDAYPTGATDFSTSLIKAKKSGAQVMLPIFDMSSSGILILQWREMRVPALPVGFISPLMGSETTTTFGDAINGVVNIIFQGGNIPLKKYEPATRFYEAYKKRWGKELQSGHMPSEAYDSVYVLAKAIEKAGSLDKDLLIKALEETDHQGSIGRIRMKDHQYVFGENPAENAILVVYQWKKGGKRVPVFPDSISEGPINKPGWVK
jgi:branched-chain amino acid transport system substrate-binding protein